VAPAAGTVVRLLVRFSRIRGPLFFGYAFLCESLHIHRGLNLITSAKEILEEQIKLLTKPKRVDGGDHDGNRSMDRSWNRNS
jgi:hypothetical protein